MPFAAALNDVPLFGTAAPLERLYDGQGKFAQPIFSFGDPAIATVATVSLNPSDREFLTRAGQPLPVSEERFHSPWLPGGPYNAIHAAGIQHDCNQYFVRLRRGGTRLTYYRGWFGSMERLLQQARTGKLSYLNGSVCHLDLSPWATRKKWKCLSQPVRDAHIQRGRPILLQQLGFAGGKAAAARTSSIRLLLLNGMTTLTEVLLALDGSAPNLVHPAPLPPSKGAPRFLNVYAGHVLGVAYVGWNIPLAQPFGYFAAKTVAPYI